MKNRAYFLMIACAVVPATAVGCDCTEVAKRWISIALEFPEAVQRWLQSRLVPPPVSQRLWTQLILRRRVQEIPWRGWDAAFGNMCAADIRDEKVWSRVADGVAQSLKRLHPDPAEVVAVVFPILYAGVAESLAPHAVWQIVEGTFPEAKYCWDKCRCLRRLLVEQFTSFEWPVSCFLKCLPETRMVRAVFESWGWSRAECRFLTGVIRDGVNNSNIKDELRFWLRQYEDWFRYS